MPRATFTYRHNTTEAAGHRQPALWAAIDLAGHGAMDRIEALPIYRTARLLPDGRLAQRYQTLVAGVAIERASLEELETSIDHYLGLLVHYGRLPEYLFQLGDRAWPIYRLEDQLTARFPGSRTFSAPTIGELRNELADHFKQVGVIDYRKGMTVLYLSRQDFQPDAPVCTLRAPGLAEMPIFRDQETVVHLVAPVNGRSIVTELAGGEGLLVLPGLVGDYLADRGRLADSDSIGVRKLSAAAWAAAARGLHPYTCSFVYTDRSGDDRERREIPIFADEARGRLVAARTNRMGRVSLHFAADIPHLQFKVGEELTEIGKIPVPTYVTIDGIEEVVHAEYVEARGSSTLAPLAL
ncbi:MAG TPA: hypothetical protein PK829_02945 [Promineifilum sp.]|nr:hypothetical protein [Promineifilum sp.]